jgi:hypothetical protein
VQHQGAFARGRRAFVGRAANTDQCVPLGEGGKHIAQALGAIDRVEFVGLRQPRRRRHIVLGAECNDQNVCIVGSDFGGDTSPIGIDLGHRLTHETHARLLEIAVWHAYRIERRVPEHDIELRVTE